MKSLDKTQEKQLRRMGQDLKAAVQVGKYGINESTLFSLNENLVANELIKVHILNNSGLTTKEAADELAVKTGSLVVQAIGKQVVLFRRNPEQPKIVFE